MSAQARSLRAVLFDAVGTLIETAEPVGESYARIARRYGVEVPPERLEDAFRRILAAAPPMAFPEEASRRAVADRERAWWRQVVRGSFRAADSSLRFDDFEACFDALWRHFAEATAWRRRAGAREALDRLRAAGLATALVSNFDGRLPAILAGLDLASRFDALALPADVGAAKPDPRIFQHALGQLGVPAEQAAFVGDDAREDLAAARGLGMTAIDVAEVASLSRLPECLSLPHQESR